MVLVYTGGIAQSLNIAGESEGPIIHHHSYPEEHKCPSLLTILYFLERMISLMDDRSADTVPSIFAERIWIPRTNR